MNNKTIPVNELIIGGIYLCRARFFNIGFWTGTEFRGVHFEYGNWVIVSEHPWEEGLPLGTAAALQPLNTIHPLNAFDGNDIIALLLAAEEIYAPE